MPRSLLPASLLLALAPRAAQADPCLTEGTNSTEWETSATLTGTRGPAHEVGLCATTWDPEVGEAAWISDDASCGFTGTFFAHTEFDLAGSEVDEVSLTLLVEVDNLLDKVYLNGSALGISDSGFTSGIINLLTIDAADGLVEGTNTLSFSVTDTGSVGGIKVRLLGTQDSAVPVQSHHRPSR